VEAMTRAGEDIFDTPFEGVDGDEDVDEAKASGAIGMLEATSTGPHATATMVGKPDEDGDLELQPMVDRRDDGSWREPKTLLYSVWPARNTFFCKGLLMTGHSGDKPEDSDPDLVCCSAIECLMPNLCAWCLILTPCTLYFVFVLPHLCQQGVYAQPAAVLMVFLMTTGFLLAACCSDPGIIPRREVILATKSAEILEERLGYDALASQYAKGGSSEGPSLPQDLTRRGFRWCRTCHIVRPPRASHCPTCDNCVMRYDHHCPFVNNCVGQRNYHFFIGFVTSVWCLAILVLPALFWHLNARTSGRKSLDLGPLQPILYAIAVCGALVVIAALMSFLLWAYHIFLIVTNKTTKEFRKGQVVEDIEEEPTLFARRGPRLFNPWARVDQRELAMTTCMPCAV